MLTPKGCEILADGSITISITGDAKDLEAELKKLQSKIKDTGKQSEQAGNTGSRFGDKISAGCKIAGAALLGVAAAAGGVALAAYKVGSSYETALAQVGTIADTSVKPLSVLSAEIMKLSSNTGIAAADIAEATYSAISATGDTANAVEIVASATQLATAGFASTGDSLSTLTGIMNAYSMQASDLESVSDSLIATQNLGVLTIGELSSSIGRAISTASAYGVGLSNLETGYIALTKAGISCDESTTYLSSMFSELGDTGSNVGKILQNQTGKSFGQLMEAGYSLSDVLRILYDDCGQNAEALMNLWGSQEAGKASNAIVSQGLEQFDGWLKQVENSSGATASAYEQMQNTISAQTGILQTNLQNLGIRLFESFSPALLSGIKQINGAIMSLSDAFETGGIEGFAAQIGTLMAQAVSALISASPQLLSTAGTIIASFASGIAQAAPQIMQVGTKLLDSLLSGIQSELPQMIPAAMEALVSFSSGLRENISQMVDAGLALITALAQSLIQNIPVFIATVPQIVTNLAGIINDNAPKLLATGLNIIGALAQGLISAIPTLIANIPQIIQAIIAVFSAFNWIQLGNMIVNGVKAGIPALGNALRTAGQNAVNAFKSINWASAGTAVCNFIHNAITGAVGLVGNALRTVATNGMNAFRSIDWASVGRAAINFIKTAISGAAGLVSSALKSVGRNAMSAFRSIDWGAVGKNVIDGIISGIQGATSALFSSLRNLASNALNAAKNALGIESPSKVFRDEVGEWIPEGVAVGIEEHANVAVKAAQNTARQTISAASLQNARLSLVADTRTAANAFTAYTTNNVYNNGGGKIVTVDYHPEQKCDEPISLRDLDAMNRRNARYMERIIKNA